MTAPARRRCAGCNKAAVPGDAFCGECQTAPGEDMTEARHAGTTGARS